MKIFILALTLGTSLTAFARGGEIGNGGDVIVCPDGIVMLDVYEAKALRKLELNLGEPTLWIDEKIDIGLKRLAQVDPWRAFSISLIAKTFFERSELIPKIKLRDIDDSKEVFLPVGCSLQQVAIQKSKALIFDPDFVVSRDLWDKLDNDNKAALILHEAAFFVSGKTADSPLIRFLNSVMFTDLIAKSTDPLGEKPNAYYKLVEETTLEKRIEAFQIQNVPPSMQKDKRWFFQIPHPTKPEISMGWVASKSEAKYAWVRECSVYRGTPIGMDEFRRISSYVTYTYRGRYAWDRPIFVKTNAGTEVLLSAEGRDQTDEYFEGTIWCVSPQNPFPI